MSHFGGIAVSGEDEHDDDATSPNHDDDVCTPEDKFCLVSVLPRCYGRLKFLNSPEIVSSLLSIPGIDHWEAEVLDILQEAPLTDLEYERLGAILENSVKTTNVGLNMFLADVPQAFCDSFANCIHIESLEVHFARTHDCTDDQLLSFFSKMLVNEHHDGALERLLRNPQSKLDFLALDGNALEDHHVIIIADLLPYTHIEEIDLGQNNIKAPGLLEFARQLPKMHSLTEINLEGNPWEESSLEVLEECGAALLHGVIENPSIRFVDCMDNVPQCPLLWHYCSLNYAGRKLLTSSSSGEQPIPDGLWPHVLSRAGRPIEKGSLSRHDGKNKYNGPANAVYFFLRNCPRILFWQESLSIL